MTVLAQFLARIGSCPRTSSPALDHVYGQANPSATTPVLEPGPNKVRWEFEWPPEVLSRSDECQTAEFAAWLIDCGRCELTRRQLVSQYAEFIEVFELRPLTWGRFDRSLAEAGFVKVRSAKGRRPWLYRLRSLEPSSNVFEKIASLRAA